MVNALQFKALCHLYSSEVYRYAWHLLGNAADAEDVTQEALLKLWNNFSTVNLLKTRSWLMSTVRHLCLDEMRRRGRRKTEALEADGPEHADESSPGPRENAQNALLAERLERALQALPEGMRSVFVLHEVNGLRCREVAAALEMPEGTVKVYLSRARERLQQMLSVHQPSTYPNDEPESERAHA